MKALFTLLLFFFLQFASAQIIIDIGRAKGDVGDTVQIDFRVENFDNIIVLQFPVFWDKDVIKALSVTNINTDLPGLSSGSFAIMPDVVDDGLRISWDDPDVAGQSLQDGVLFFTLKCEIVGPGSSFICIENSPNFHMEVFNIQLEEESFIIHKGGVNIKAATIRGYIKDDENNDCLLQMGERGIPNWIVKIEGENTYYATTTSSGYFEKLVDTGSYTVSLTYFNDIWTPCENDIETGFLADSIEQEILFPAMAEYRCPDMEVDIQTPRLRRCFKNTYYVHYCNNGSETAAGASIDVQLDPYMSFQSSTILEEDLGNNLYNFFLGNVEAGSCGDFSITVSLDCDSTVLGQTHCVEAHIYPDTICMDPNPAWSGASLDVEASCEDDSIRFEISNVGQADAQTPSRYIIIQDVVGMFEGDIQLPSGDTYIHSVPADGSTWRMEVKQVPFHPGNSNPSVSVEGCGTDDMGNVSRGFITQFSQDEDDDFISIDCKESIGSYDPNDKTGYPRGRSNEHYIEEGTGLEYLIRFQNTGTDTAFKVVIIDTIERFLDMSTIQAAASSHPYQFDIVDERAVKVTYDNILLPDSTTNEPASHGFILLKIKPHDNLPIGTVVENKADIFFDFNQPVRTNTTFHTIGEPIMVSVDPGPWQHTSLKVYPNPANHELCFDLPSSLSGNCEFELFTIDGKRAMFTPIRKQCIKLPLNRLTTGLYFYRIIHQGHLIGNGKVIIK